MEITREDIIKRAKTMKFTREPIQKRWDYYRNDVAREPYFPQLHKESAEHYKKRLKIAIGWCGSLADRVAAYFRKGPIRAQFMVDGKEDATLAKEAADTWAEIAEYNNWDIFMIDVARDAGVGGNGYTKERVVFYDHETGRDLTTGAFRGRVLIDRVAEGFVYRMPFAGVNAFIEAWFTINGQAHFIHEEGFENDESKREHVELILPSYHNVITGKLEMVSAWSIWDKEQRIYGPEEIKHALPIQRYANLVSRPESENGMSDIERLIPIANYINHTVSGMVRAIEYHGEPKVVAQGVEDDSEIKWGTDNLICLPGVTPGGGGVPQMKYLVWNQNVEGARAVVNDGASTISALSGVPKHMMHDLDGSGKVPSGVALRIIYESLNQLCTLKEAGFEAGEKKTIKACLDQLAFYNNKPGHFDDVTINIKYNPDRTPRDLDAEIMKDLKLKVIGYLNLIDLVLKYESGIETREQALEFLKQKAEEKKKLQEMGLIQAAPTFDWKDDDSSSSDKKVPEGD